MVSYNKRAINSNQKAERREVIIRAALDCFERPTFAELTMAEISRTAGVSKGTLYLYFQSKEELFLQALLELYEDWFRSFEPAPTDLVEHVIKSLEARPKLLELMSMAPSVMEANAPIEAVLEFKRALALGLDGLSQAVNVEPRRLMWAYAIIVGLHSTSNPPPDLRKKIQEESDLVHFQLDFSSELRALLKHIL